MIIIIAANTMGSLHLSLVSKEIKKLANDPAFRVGRGKNRKNSNIPRTPFRVYKQLVLQQNTELIQQYSRFQFKNWTSLPQPYIKKPARSILLLLQ